MTTHPLGLDDSDFWSDPRRTRGEIENRLMDADQEAILYDAPDVVPIDIESTAPTQALRVARLATLKQWPFRENAVVVVVDLDNNIVQAALAVEPPDRSFEDMPASATPAQEGMGSETFTIDLRERLNVPWETAHMLARLVVADQVTEPRSVLFRAANYVDPEIQRFRDKARSKPMVPAVVPTPGPWVAYTPDEQTPTVPSGECAIHFQLTRVCLLDSPDPCWLRGSFRLNVLKRHIVPPSLDSGEPAPGADALRFQWPVDWQFPVAVVPITIVAVGSTSVGPMVWRLVLPIFAALEGSAEQPVGVGSFAVDLRRLDGFGSVEQTWFLYAFSDTLMVGPMSIGLTRRPRTP